MNFKDLSYYGFNMLEFIIKYTPMPFVDFLKKILLFSVYHLDNKRKKVICINLNLAYGNTLSKEKKEEITKKVYENFINNLFEFIELSFISKEELRKRIEFKNLDKIKEYLNKGPVIFSGAHFGNWEIATSAIGAFVTPISAVVRNIDNPKLNEKIKRTREKFGVRIYNKKGALKKLMRDLKNNKSIGILVDQNTAENEGVETVFFGKKVLHTPSACLLSKKFKIPIVMGFVEKEKDKWIIDFKEIFYADDIKKCVDKQSKIIEEEVKQYPELWYWMHRRFKHFYENEYNKKCRV
ncbi:MULTISPECIES: lipid A biosynthesis lauroyl acyltransferase [unclassified Lebetimonas]|uniref:lipid A biosynthesis lauroyl acyltransferase n=1 Tax=unclassified Lebetimonas TaxID=2648158 RepID=UPI000465AD4D|nr:MULTISPECIES: lipid A biosynthesis lauroyl acyltransferase [unclassified Lebetimonas]